jgi:hypothetical protein
MYDECGRTTPLRPDEYFRVSFTTVEAENDIEKLKHHVIHIFTDGTIIFIEDGMVQQNGEGKSRATAIAGQRGKVGFGTSPNCPFNHVIAEFEIKLSAAGMALDGGYSPDPHFWSASLPPPPPRKTGVASYTGASPSSGAASGNVVGMEELYQELLRVQNLDVIAERFGPTQQQEAINLIKANSNTEIMLVGRSQGGDDGIIIDIKFANMVVLEMPGVTGLLPEMLIVELFGTVVVVDQDMGGELSAIVEAGFQIDDLAGGVLAGQATGQINISFATGTGILQATVNLTDNKFPFRGFTLKLLFIFAFSKVGGGPIFPADSDGDSILDELDNCPHTSNPDQQDSNFNGIGNTCETSDLRHSTAAFLQAGFNGSTTVEPTPLPVGEEPPLSARLARIVDFRINAGLATSATQLTRNLVQSQVDVGLVPPAETDALIEDVLSSVCVPGDLDCDGDVDRNDLNILLADRNKSVSQSACGTLCDLDGDGIITALDARKLTLLCTRLRCAAQ